MKLLLDINLILDILLRREPHFASSAQIFDLCEKGLCEGFFAAQSYATLFYLLRKNQGKELTYQTLHLLRKVLQTAPLTASEVDFALASGFKDFEDALQYFVAISCGAAYVLTRNPKDYPEKVIHILTPVEFLALHFPDRI